jgi:HEAT repeat protein
MFRKSICGSIAPLATLNQGSKRKKRSAVSRYFSPRISERLIAALQDEDAQTRYDAIRRLQELGDPEAAVALVTAMEDPCAKCRAAAAVALGWLEAPSSVDALVTHLLEDESPDVRACCLLALRSVRRPGMVDTYIRALRDPSERVVYAACKALGDSRDPKAVQPLHELLEHPSWKVRFYASEALVRLGAADRSVVATLETLIQEPAAHEHDQMVDEVTGVDLPMEWRSTRAVLEEARRATEKAA